MATYAKETNVSVERTRAEIEHVLTRFGCEGFMYGWQADQATIAFISHQRQIRFQLPLPDPYHRDFTRTPTGLQRTDKQRQNAYEQEIRSRWRALGLIIKAKLAAVEAGVVSFEDEFLAQTVIASNQTVSDYVQPQLARSYDEGEVPRMLPLPEGQVAIEEAEIVS